LSARRPFAIVVVVLALAACSGPAPSAPEYDVVAEALKAFDRSEWAPASRLLRDAIAKQPMSVRLHYSLGVSATHLELRDEAIREFRWVLANAPAGSPEAVAARNWLIAAGALPTEGPTFSTSTGASPPAAVDFDRGDSGLKGRVTWSDGDPPIKLERLQLFLKGIPGTPNQDIQLVLRTDNEGNFEFRQVPAGEYKLTNRIAGEPLWRLKVNIPPSETVAFDLSESNSTRVRDDFPTPK
jgi:hypothetical protein